MSLNFLDINTLDADTTYTLTSAASSVATLLYDNNRSIQLQSSGSDDVTPEVWLFEFSPAETVDRILIDNHNIKSGDIKYWNGAAYVDFSTPISYSGETATTHYHEFNSVSTLRIQLTMNTTQTVDAEKVVGQFIATTEIGEVETDPAKIDFELVDAKVLNTTSLGRTVNVTFDTTNYAGELLFTDASDTDMTLFRNLKDRTNPFYMLPSGGLDTRTQEGFRLRDYYFVTIVNDYKPELKGDILGINSIYAMEVMLA